MVFNILPQELHRHLGSVNQIRPGSLEPGLETVIVSLRNENKINVGTESRLSTDEALPLLLNLHSLITFKWPLETES